MSAGVSNFGLRRSKTTCRATARPTRNSRTESKVWESVMVTNERVNADGPVAADRGNPTKGVDERHLFGGSALDGHQRRARDENGHALRSRDCYVEAVLAEEE